MDGGVNRGSLRAKGAKRSWQKHRQRNGEHAATTEADSLFDLLLSCRIVISEYKRPRSEQSRNR